MRRARDPESPLRQKKDPYDQEAAYRRPIAPAELVRVSIKGVVIVGAGVWFKFASDTEIHEGAKLAGAAGTALVCAGLIDLYYLRTRSIEQVFLDSKAKQLAARVALVVLGVGLLIGALLTYSL
jgi:hypothetical protein